jgi:hypothetical protein
MGEGLTISRLQNWKKMFFIEQQMYFSLKFKAY